MTEHALAAVTTANGLNGEIDRDRLAQAGAGELVGIRLQNGQQLWVLPGTLVAQPDGGYLLPVAVPREAGGDGGLTSERTIIPVIEEEAVITTRPVESGGVRIAKRVHEHEETARVTVMAETLDVRREPADEFPTQTEAAHQEGDTWVVPVYEEVLVVEKRLHLRERVYVTKRQSAAEQAQPVTLRREEVIVEPLDDVPAPGDPSP